MKKFTTISLALIISCCMVSCANRAERAINELESIVERVEENYMVYTEKDWEDLFEEVDELTEKYSDVKYTQAQWKKIQKLNSKLSEHCVEQAVANFGSFFSGAMEGLVDGLQIFVDGLEKVVDEIEMEIEDR